MRPLATLSSRWLPLFVVALSALCATPASAQIDLTWDHYKVYDANPKVPGPTYQVNLVDQFGQYEHQVLYLDKFMNPVEKFHLASGIGYGINDEILHYTWWRIQPQPFEALLTVNNQFGTQNLYVTEAEYLLNPATKNDPMLQLPEENHYKCYRCQGQPITVPLRLTDQFDTWNVQYLMPEYFCNPVAKYLPFLVIYPIRDDRQHYVCYHFDPPDPSQYVAFVQDQFGQFNLNLAQANLLCVPTDKLRVTNSEEKSWGQLKILYR